MSTLGITYRIVYEAKNQKTGLTDVKANIVKPDATTLGPLAMTEFSQATHKGFYFFDLITTGSDPEGEWIGTFDSPTEAHAAGFRISFFKMVEISTVTNIFTGPEFLTGQISSETLEGNVEQSIETLSGKITDQENLSGEVTEEVLSGTVTEKETISGKINEDTVTGVLEGCIK